MRLGSTTGGARPLSTRAIRVLNVLVATFGLILTAPLFLAIAVLVKLSSPGPVFYVQERVGLDRRNRRPDGSDSDERRQDDKGGRIFRIYKFRTMVADSDKAGQVWASRTDPRITAVGHVLRKYRLDELPQLFNVLKGDMNIVGPRPEQPKIFRELREKVNGYQDRQRVLPGITGWAQVNHSYDQSIEDVKKKVEYDLEYIEQRSFLKDLRIMARTVPVMIGKKGSI
ncbi:MAG: sugar transferase [Gemmatimonadota bacterium]